MAISCRPASAADLPAIDDIYYQSEMRGVTAPPPPRAIAGLRYILATGNLVVAERDGEIIGFAGRVVRGDVAYLTDLFVREEQQSGRVGQALLAAALPHDTLIRCTLASVDFRAHALYVRDGMRPRWPNYWLHGVAGDLGELPTSDLTTIEANFADPALLAWDTEVSGRSRPGDHAYWRDVCGATPLWFRRGGETVGYGVVSTRGSSSLWYPDAFTLGPIGARRAEDAAACVCATVAWARARGVVLRLALPGAHPALAPLLAAGFRIVYVETFLSTAETPFFDPERYTPSGDLVL